MSAGTSTVRARALVLVATTVLSLLAASATAKPDARGGSAAARHAMNDLFAAAKFAEARDALTSAIRACGSCSKPSKALLHADLGIVLLTGFQEREKAVAEFSKARQLDPGVVLDETFVTDEIRSAFEEAEVPAENVTLEEEPSPGHEEEPAAPECGEDQACEDGKVCRDGTCVAAPPKPKKDASVWLGLGLIQDAAFLSGSDVCSRASQVSGGFNCLRSSGAQYHGTPLPGQGGKPGGLALATTRLTLSTSFAVSHRIGLGIRVGYAVAGRAPTPDGGKRFLPVYAELQGAYFVTGQAYSPRSIGTFVEVSGGVAQTSGSASVPVRENTAVPPPAYQIDNPPEQHLDAYQSFGSSFAGVGFGAFLPVSGAFALVADVRVSAFFPTSGAVLSLGIGAAFGL